MRSDVFFAKKALQGVLTVAFQRTKRRKRRILALVLFALLATALLLRRGGGKSESIPAMKPFDGLVTDQSLCAVTVSLTGIESRASLELFGSVCAGMDVRPCLFVTNDWLEEHRSELSDFSYAELGLLFEREPGGATRKRVMSNLAEENERFLSLTGTFPRFVRLASGGPSDAFSAALQAYGQVCVGSRCGLTDAPSPGAVADCGQLNGTTGYALAKYCAGALADGYTVLALSDLQKYV